MKVYFFDSTGHYKGASAERDECPINATTIQPDCEYAVWDGKKWVIDEAIEKETWNNAVYAKLADIDMKSIRALRDGDATWIAKYKKDAEDERGKLK